MNFLKEIEEKWRKRWKEFRIFESDLDSKKPKYFITVAYPYPNSPQHIGHGRTYTLADVHARYMRMCGYNVLFPMAFHYTGTPVLAMAKRLADNDEELVSDFLNIYKIPKNKLCELMDPLAMARYFHEEIKSGMMEMGYSFDWRREFTTIDSEYQNFIEWQFRKLLQAGYITRGSHPVGWCPKDENPVGQHDTIGDIEPEIGEFTLIKFKHGDLIFPAATLRPETIFGVTNLWLKPDASYVKANVNNEQWIISKECLEKLYYLNLKVKVVESFLGKKFIGKYVKNPATEDDLLILPADFVDPKNATGVVMSVPGHAPYDFIALKNIKKNESIIRKYKLIPEILEAIKPISIITVPDYSEFPAGFVAERMNIQNQSDPKLEKATKEVYRHEFHNGKMKRNTGKYSGLSVVKAKDIVKEELLLEKKAEIMYELLNQQVFCRCGTECVVKIFKDQWFIDYGRSEWKALAHKNLDRIEILPEELRAEFNYVIDWLHEKACARKSGLGTKLPWDPEWIIESLSDSTIYMAYYIIGKYVKEQKIHANQLTDEVFDYIFLGIGNASEISKKMDLDSVLLEQMYKEFKYFYPLDSRHSGRDLVSNHLTFMIFNHTAIFPEDLWPRQIVTNGSVMMEGVKMSKSFGNIIPLREALSMFGADPLRLSVLTTAELLQDAEFSPSIAKSMRDRLERLYNFTKETFDPTYNQQISKGFLTIIDKWMLSRLQIHIKKTTEAMNKLSVRKALQIVLYDLDQDFQWYKKQIKSQKEKKERKGVIFQIFKEVLEVQIKMLSPAAPYISEELWELMGKKGFIAQSSWPIADETKIDVKIEEQETLIINVLKDTLKIIQATDIIPKKIYYYVAASWKWKTYLNILKTSILTKLTQQNLMKNLMEYPDLKAKARNVSKFVSQMIPTINKLPAKKKERLLQIGIINESKVINESLNTFERNLNAEIYLFSEDNSERYDPKDKAKTAKPYRPAIYIE